MKESSPIIQEKKKNRFERFLKILKKSVVVGMIGLATSQSAESHLGTYIGHFHGKKTHVEILNKEKERPAMTLENIRRMIIQDESERMFVGTDKALYEVEGGEKESGLIKFEDIQNVIDKGEGSPIVGHTHPISVYDNIGYTHLELDEMRSKNESPTPMPPSLTDVMGSVNTTEHFSDQDITIRERVYDPTGIWEYKIQDDNPAIKLFLGFYQNLNKALEANITTADRQIMKKLGLDHIHPAKRVAALKSNEDTRVLGEKIEEVSDEYLENISEGTWETLEKFAELEILAVRLAGAKKAGYDERRIKNIIDDYIQTAKGIGIQVSYIVN